MQNPMNRKNRSDIQTRKNGLQKNTALWAVILSLFITCVLAVGCGGSKTANDEGFQYFGEKTEADYSYSVESGNGMIVGDMEMVESPADSGLIVDKSDAVNTSGNNGVQQQVNSSRKLITTVNMTTETEHYDDLMSWLSARITQSGGYVEYSESDGNQSSRRRSTLTLRIPAENLDAFLVGLSEESNVTYESRSVKDITLNYVDVQSHKQALLVEQERLLALLEKAENLEDLLKIESRLTQVRYELESYESQLRTYDNQVDYSTVHLTVREVKVLTAPEPESFWERVTAGFKDNLQDVTHGFTEFAIDFLSSIPTILVWVVILTAAWILLSKICKARKAKAASQPKEKKTKKRWGKKADKELSQAGSAEYTGGYTYGESQPDVRTDKKDGE